MRRSRWCSTALGLLIACASVHAQVPLSIQPAIDDAPTKAHDYDWLSRHYAVLGWNYTNPVDLLMIGDSITHGWGGDTPDAWHGKAQDIWDTYYKPRHASNLGFGWDKTEHVLWRFEHGELDHVHPKVAVVMIGTNNVARDSVDDVATGVGAVVHYLRGKLHRTKVLLLAIFPRDHTPDGPNRTKIVEINKKIAELGKEPGVTYLDIGPLFLDPDGTISKDMMNDYLHPTHKGYEIWAKAMEPVLSKLMGDRPK